MSLTCEASIPANSDIGGPGVLSAFLASAWLSIVAALTACINTGRAPKWSRRSSEVPERCWPERLLEHLCDLQAITGLGIVSAGLSGLYTNSLYHSELANTYWWFTMNSFWATRPAFMNLSNDMNLWRVRLRRLTVLGSTVVGIVYQSLLIIHERDWDDVVGDCYRYTDKSYVEPMAWFWVSTSVFWALTLVLLLFGQEEMLVDAGKRISRIQHATAKSLFDWEGWQEWCTGNNASDTTRYRSYVLAGILWPLYALGFAIFWIFVETFAIWSYGGQGYGQSLSSLTVIIAFQAWNTYDAISLRIENKVLLDGDELKMGFGQVLPLFMLLQIVYSSVDVWHQKHDNHETTSAAETKELK